MPRALKHWRHRLVEIEIEITIWLLLLLFRQWRKELFPIVGRILLNCSFYGIRCCFTHTNFCTFFFFSVRAYTIYIYIYICLYELHIHIYVKHIHINMNIYVHILRTYNTIRERHRKSIGIYNHKITHARVYHIERETR